MKKAFKSIFIILVILAGVVLAAPYFVGKYAQSTYENMVAAVNSFSNSSIKITNYHRGWFSSTATLQVNMQNIHQSELAKDFGEKLKTTNITVPKINYIIIKQNIKNGPVIYDNGQFKFALAIIHGKVQFQMKKGQESQFLKGLAPLISKTTVINLNRSIASSFTIKPYHYKDNMIKFDFSGLNAQATATADLKHILGNSAISSISFNTIDNKTNVQMTGIKASISKTQYQDDIWVGKTGLSINKISARFQNKPIATINSFQLNNQTKVHDNLLDIMLTNNVSQILISHGKFGPLKVDVAIKNIDISALEKIKQQLKDYAKNPNNKLSPMLPIAMQLLSKSPKLVINNISLVTSNGGVALNGQLSVPKSSNANPMMAVMGVNGNLNVAIAQPLLKQLLISEISRTSEKFSKLEAQSKLPPDILKNQTSQVASKQVAIPERKPAISNEQAAEMMMAFLQKQGIIKLDGQQYDMALTYKDQKLMVNGKEMEPSMIMMLYLQEFAQIEKKMYPPKTVPATVPVTVPAAGSQTSVQPPQQQITSVQQQKTQKTNNPKAVTGTTPGASTQISLLTQLPNQG